MNRFGFIDSSGIIKQDKFFGVGLLVVGDIGNMIDKLAKNCQVAYNTVKNNKNAALTHLLNEGKKDEVIHILRSSKRFEMKFDNVRASTHPYYKRMLDIFFADGQNRFSAMVIDKENPTFDANIIHDTWEAYTGYSASLTVVEMRNLATDKFCIIVDEITKPNTKTSSLEATFLSKVKNKLLREKNISTENLFGALSIESHSNLLMQLSDVLLGAVMYDFKRKNQLTSNKVERKKEELVKTIRTRVAIDSLAQNFTRHTPTYFSVFEATFQNKKNSAQ